MRQAAYTIVATLLATPAVAQDRTLTMDMTEVYRVGGVNEPEWAFFGSVSPTGFDGVGNLLVLDRRNKRVIVIGPDGRFAVPDMGHSAIQVLSPDGELDRFVRMVGEDTSVPMAGFRQEIRADPPSDMLIAQGVESVVVALVNDMNRRMGLPEDETPPGVDDRALETLDLSGDVMVPEPILQGWKAPRPEHKLSPADEEDWSKVVEMMEDRYFEPEFHWDVLPDGTIAYSDSSAYAIKLARPDGSLTDVLRRRLSPERVSQRVRQAMIVYSLEGLGEELERAPSIAVPFMGPDFEERRREEIRSRGFYHEVPVVRGIEATWDGGLWIQRRGSDAWDDEGPIDVFNADREYLGTLSAGDPPMPAAFGPDDLVVHWERDELAVPTLVVSRLSAERR